ncbi:MAG: hypothetical protein PHO92_04060 [Candidatus Peribacteraceae bacterium]|nr:hypothetical protein [Candidatus Peribacteraceae bacterium]
MAMQILQKIRALEFEEKILNGSLLIAFVGIFFPWIGGKESLIDDTSRIFTGLGFHTGFIGLAVLALVTYVLLITIVPLTSRTTIIRRQHKSTVRLLATSLATILTLAALSVLYKVTFESPGLEVRFGVYVTIVGTLIATLYAFLAYQEEHRAQVRQMFHHPEDEDLPQEARQEKRIQQESQQNPLFQAPQPPPPPEPEEHKMHHLLPRK